MKSLVRGLGFRGDSDVLVEMLMFRTQVIVSDCKLCFIMGMLAGF